MKTTAVVESLSTIQPDVLFQRLPAYFKRLNCAKITLRFQDHSVTPIQMQHSDDPMSLEYTLHNI